MNLKNVLVTLLIWFSFSCSKVKIKDSEFCGDMGAYGASCFNTLSDGTRDIEKEDWDKERLGMICSSPATFSEWKKAILKLCKKSKRCKFKIKKKVELFGQRVNEVELRFNSLPP